MHTTDPSALKRSRCVLLLIQLIALAAAAAPARAAEAPTFRIGVYLYEYHLAATAAAHQRDYADFLDEHLRILHDHGVNAIYLGGTSPERFDAHLRLAAKHGMAIIPQLDFAYFQPSWSDDQTRAYAKTAGEFIRRHQDDPRVLAWSVREEVPAAAVGALARYYALIREHAPRARFNMIHNNLPAAREQPAPHASIYGTDRYAFWFETSAGGYLASPSFALDWTRTQAAEYAAEAARRDADFMLVVTQGGLLMPQWANDIVNTPPAAGDPGTPDEQRQLAARVLRFARDGRMGWREVRPAPGAPPRYNVWKYYRLPENCMKALAWTSVLEGARHFFCWHYCPPRPADLASSEPDAAATVERPPYEVEWITLAGRPGVDNPQLRELAHAARELRPYERLIPRMSKLPDSPVECPQIGVHHRAFALPNTGVAGSVLVLHNANVGTWPHDSRHFFHESDDIRIDDQGNLVGYTPFKDPLPVRFTLRANAVAKLFDLRTGRELPPSDQGQYRVDIGPGSGTLLFLGSAEEAASVHASLNAD
jgi:hypothetical protein